MMGTTESQANGLAIALLAAIQLISWGTCFYTFGLILIMVETDLGMGRSSAALAFPLALLFEGVCSIFVGRWIACGLGGHVMAGGSLLAGAGLWTLGHANSSLEFHAAWVLIGASFACTLYTPLFSLISMRFPLSYRRKVTAISLITGLSSTIFLPLGSWLMAEIGWRHCLIFYAMLNFLLCAPGQWFALRSIRPESLNAGHAEKAPDSNVDIFIPGNRKIYICLAVFTSAIGAVSATVAAHLIPMLMGRGVSLEASLMAPAAIGALQILSRVPMLIWRMEKNLHQANFCLILIFPLAMALLQLSGTSHHLLMLFIMLYGIAHGGWTIVRATAVPLYLGVQGAEIINGKIAFWSMTGRIGLPALVALLWNSNQGYYYGYWLLLMTSILGFFSYSMAQKICLNNAN